MNPLGAIIAGGLLTFAMRYSFIYLFGRLQLPEALRRLLRFVPPAVFAAIVAPELLLHSGGLDLSFANQRLIAGALAVLVAWWTKNTLVTIVAGMALLVVLQLLF